MHRFLVFLFLFIACSHICPAQPANRHFDAARKLEIAKNYRKATREYWKAVQSGTNDPYLYAVAGDYFLNRNEFDYAVKTFEKAALKASTSQDFTLLLAKAYVLDSQYDKANTLLYRKQNIYTTLHPRYQEYSKLQKDVNFHFRYQTDTLLPAPLNLGSDINSRYDEYFPSIHGNDEELVFTRRTNGVDEDFYTAYKDSLCNWTRIEDLGIPFNTSRHESAHFMSFDRNYMFYMRCGNPRTNESTMGGCDLYMAYRKDTTWSEGEPFGPTINTAHYEGMPCLSSDNKTLYFVSDKPGGFGGKDIYVTQYTGGLWQLPQNLGDVINTPYDEMAPFLAIDHHTLYFSSNGHPGFGGMDIFVSYRNADGSWSPPQNLGHTINTPYNEMSLVMHANGEKAYFASDKPDGHGGYDLYEVAMPDKVKPQPMSIVYGRITDTFTNYKLANAIIEFFDTDRQQVLQTVVSNRGDGSYVVALPVHTPVAQKVFRFGYRDFLDTFILDRQMVAAFDIRHIQMVPDGFEYPEEAKEDIQITYDLTRINFQKNQLHISDDILQPVLMQLREFRQPGFTIQIYSYTDDSGTPFINQDYSLRRAQLVADALLKEGFREDQMDIKGWGDANAVVPNDSENNRFLNRRIEIKITGSEHLFQTLSIWQH